jgi:hypothetical protein
MKKVTNKKITTMDIVKFLEGKTKEQKKEILFNYFYKKKYVKKDELH